MIYSSIRNSVVFLGLVWAGCAVAAAQSWQIPYRQSEVQVDGFLDEWEGIPELVLEPGRVRTEGEFDSDDLRVSVKAQWDDESLYLAIDWADDVWDVRKIRRSEAVLVASDRKRYDRMLFFDNFKFQIESLKYDYLLWTSPRVNDEGPYYWQRRREGLGSMEGATTPPVITPRQDGQRVTVELLFFWKELRLKPKQLIKKGFPLFLTVADSDLPGYIEEGKLPHLKSLSWDGNVALIGK